MNRCVLSGIILVGLMSVLSYLTHAASEEKLIEDDVYKIASDNSEFAFDLYHQLKNDHNAIKPNGNLFFSPYSISTALAMTYAGAGGETQKQMAKILHFTLPGERLHQAVGNLEKKLNTKDNVGGYELRVANALWCQKGEFFFKEFLEVIRKYYGAGIKQLNFVQEAEESRKIINAWVNKKTILLPKNWTRV